MGEALNSDNPRVEYSTELMTVEVFDRYWPSISRELDCVPHIWDRWFTKEQIHADALSNKFAVWAVGPPDQIRVVVFTRINEYPASRILQLCIALGNDIERCLPSLMAALESYANTTKCQYAEIVGREGWEKLLPGFKRTAVVLSRKFEPFKVN